MEKPKIHSGHIEVAISLLIDVRSHLIVPNVHWGWDLRHEADLITVDSKNRVTEIEIKISLSDLKADFKKGHTHQNRKIGRLYYAIPIELLEKALPLIPLNCGIITVEWSLNTYFKAKFYRMVRYSKEIPPITDSQKLKLAELGCMRVWSLKNILYKKIQ
jgi:hypothetical protein